MNNLVTEDITNINENWVLKDNITEVGGTRGGEYQYFIPMLNRSKRMGMDETSASLKNQAEKRNFENEDTEKEISERLNLQLSKFSMNKEVDIKRQASYTYGTQRWIGYVTEIDDRKFRAKLEEINSSGTYEIATFDFKDTFDEQDMIKPGAIFYFSLGYNVSRGTRTKQQFLRFQRLSELPIKEFDEVSDKAVECSSWLDFD